MYLHKYNIPDVGTVFLESEKRTPGKLNLNLPVSGFPSVSAESVEGALKIIKGKLKDEPLPPEEEKKEPEAGEEKEPEKKATYADILRQYAGVIRQYASTLKD